MRINWTRQAYVDLDRLRWFLSEKSERAADAAVQRIVQGSLTLREHANRGQVLERYLPRQVRRLLVADYELRYEIHGEDLYITAVFHMREER
jgi:plasmid stabilization system protein ParE